MFCLITSSNLSNQKFEFSLKVMRNKEISFKKARMGTNYYSNQKKTGCIVKILLKPVWEGFKNIFTALSKGYTNFRLGAF